MTAKKRDLDKEILPLVDFKGAVIDIVAPKGPRLSLTDNSKVRKRQLRKKPRKKKEEK